MALQYVAGELAASSFPWVMIDISYFPAQRLWLQIKRISFQAYFLHHLLHLHEIFEVLAHPGAEEKISKDTSTWTSEKSIYN